VVVGKEKVGGKVLRVNVYVESCVRFCKRENRKKKGARHQKKNEDSSAAFTNPTHRQRERDDGEGEVGKNWKRYEMGTNARRGLRKGGSADSSCIPSSP